MVAVNILTLRIGDNMSKRSRGSSKGMLNEKYAPKQVWQVHLISQSHEPPVLQQKVIARSIDEAIVRALQVGKASMFANCIGELEGFVKQVIEWCVRDEAMPEEERNKMKEINHSYGDFEIDGIMVLNSNTTQANLVEANVEEGAVGESLASDFAKMLKDLEESEEE